MKSKSRRAGPTPQLQHLDSALVWLGRSLVLAKVALVPLVFDWAAEDAFALPKSALSRGLAYLMAGVLVPYLAMNGLRPLRSRFWLAVLAYVLVAAVATVQAVHPPTSLFGAHRRFLGLTSILDNATFAICVALFIRNQRDLRLLAAAFFGSAAIVMGYALIQLAGHDPLRWAEANITSTIGNPAPLAAFVLAIVAASSAALLTNWREIRPTVRVVLIALTLLGVGELLLIGARGPVLALPIALGVALLVAARGAGVRLRWRAAAVLAGLASVLALVVVLYTPAGARLVRLVTGGDASTAERLVIYQASLNAAAGRPLLGAGPDGLVSVYLTARPPESALLVSELITPMQSSTHSWILHQALGTGVIGLLAYCAVILAALRIGWSKLAMGQASAVGPGIAVIVSILVQGMVNVNHVVTESVLWLGLGLVAADEHSSSRERQGSGKHFVVLALLALAASAWLSLTVSRSVLASHAALASSALVASPGGASERFAEAAVGLDPNRGHYWNVLGLARAAKGLETAIDAFERAAAMTPYDSTYYMNAAKEALRHLGRSPRYGDLALRHARRAVEVDPYNAETHLIYGRSLIEHGDTEAAIDEAQRALSLSSSRGRYRIPAYALAVTAYAATERFVDAERALREAIALAEPEQDPRQWDLRADLAFVLLRLGRLAEAEMEARRVLAVRPGHRLAAQVLDTLEVGGRP